MVSVTADSCGYAFLDLDINHERSKLATAAAFVDATDSRYGFSSKHLLHLGGSELSRIPELISSDHEWSSRDSACGGIITKPSSSHGNRIVLRLFWDVAPLACENFATLCANGSLLPGQSGKSKPPPVGESGKPLTFRNSIIHRVVPGFVMQGGDFVFGNGSGGESIYGKKFKDERAGLLLKHDRRGVLSMGNSGKNSNSSQFFLTFNKASQCDGKHVVFGEVVSGFPVLQAIEDVGQKSGEPSVPVEITDCGVFEPLQTPGCGFWYDKPDPESFTGISPIFMVRPRALILAPSPTVSQKFVKAMEDYACVINCINAESCDSVEDQRDRILEALGTFSADVVIVAPACHETRAMLTELPTSWRALGSDIQIEEVILTAKPIEAVSQICAHSWLATKRKHWQLEGVK